MRCLALKFYCNFKKYYFNIFLNKKYFKKHLAAMKRTLDKSSSNQ